MHALVFPEITLPSHISPDWFRSELNEQHKQKRRKQVKTKARLVITNTVKILAKTITYPSEDSH